MGGSGDSPYTGGGYTSAGQEGSDELNCLALRIDTIPDLASAVAEVTAGDIVEVSTLEEGGVPYVAALDDNGELVAVIIDDVVTLLGCLAEGIAFVGHVVSASPTVRILIRPADLDTALEGHSFEDPALDTAQIEGRLAMSGNGADAGSSVVLVDAEGTTRPLAKVGISPLRALVRAGVEFTATTSEASGDLVVSLTDQ